MIIVNPSESIWNNGLASQALNITVKKCKRLHKKNAKKVAVAFSFLLSMGHGEEKGQGESRGADVRGRIEGLSYSNAYPVAGVGGGNRYEPFLHLFLGVRHS